MDRQRRRRAERPENLAHESRPRGALLALCLACLLSAGCSFLDRASYAEPDGPESVKVLACNPITGSLSFMGPALESSMRMAAEEINTQGGILGRPLRLLLTDTHSDEQAALVEAKHQVAKYPDIVAIAGAAADAVSKTLLVDIAEDAITYGTRIPIVSPASTSAEFVGLLDKRNLFSRTVCSSQLQGGILADKARDLGYTVGAAVWLRDLNNRRIFESFRDRFGSFGSEYSLDSYFYEDLSLVTISETITRAFEETQQRRGVAPQFLLVLAYGADGKLLLNEWARRYSSTPLLLSGSLNSDFFLLSLDRGTLSALESGVVDGIFPTTGGATRGAATFRGAFCARFPQHCGCERESCEEPEELEPGIYTANAYDAVYSLAFGLTYAAHEDPDAINRDVAWDIEAIRRGILRGINRDGGGELTIFPGEWGKALEAIRGDTEVDYDGTSTLEMDLNGDPLNCNFIFWSIEDGKSVFRNSDGNKESISITL